jgi:hypothetical protein
MTEPSLHTDRDPGSMTAIMRAVSARRPPRLLRVGIVRAGRVVEERLCKRHETITIGRDEGATFVLPDGDAPRRASLMEREDGAYHLRVHDFEGRIALDGGVHDLATLRARGGRVRLDESSRGRIVVGRTTVLFQFVPAPPASPRPRLPLSVRQGSTLDAGITIIAAFSFLAHFGLVGALYSDWSDPIVDESISVGALVHLGAMMPAPTVETRPMDDAPRPPQSDAKKEPPSRDTHAPRADARATGAAPVARGAESSRDAAMAREATAMGMAVLGSFGSQSAIEEALARAQIPPLDLGEAARDASGVTHADRALHFGNDGLVMPVLQRGLGGIAGATGAGADGRVREARVKPPRTEALVEPARATSPVPNAERTVALLRPRFRLCYNRGLLVDPGMSGSVLVRAKIAPNGEVAHVDAARISGLSSEVAGCIARVVRDAQFDPPGPLGSTLDIPVKVTQQ